MMIGILRLLAVFFLLILPRCASSSPPAAAQERARAECDLLIHGGSIVTMGPMGTLENSAIAVRGNEIIDVAATADLQARYRAKETIDARGMAVLPGFVNAHTHAPMTLFRGIADDRDLMDWLQNFIFPAEAKNVDADFVRWGTRLAALEMIRSGTTTFADMYYFEADIAREVRAAGLRGVLGETMLDFPAPDNETWEDAVAYVRRYVAEFKNDRLIVPALAPHAPFTVSRQHLIETRKLATELGVPLLIHVAETTDELRQVAERSNGMSPVQYLDSLEFLGDDVLVAHAIWVNQDDIRVLAQKGVGVAHCPESNMMLASGVAPIVEMRAARIELGLGTDGPAGSNNNLDMIEEMASAARLQKITKKDPKALSAHDVLEMATIGGARALGLAGMIGSIEKGKRADIAIVDLRGVRSTPVYSVESAIVYAASGVDVATTIVDGKILMRDRILLTLDEPAILQKANEYRDRIRASLTK